MKYKSNHIKSPEDISLQVRIDRNDTGVPNGFYSVGTLYYVESSKKDIDGSTLKVPKLSMSQDTRVQVIDGLLNLQHLVLATKETMFQSQSFIDVQNQCISDYHFIDEGDYYPEVYIFVVLDKL